MTIGGSSWVIRPSRLQSARIFVPAAVLEAVEAQVLVSAAGLLRVGPADNTFPLG